MLFSHGLETGLNSGANVGKPYNMSFDEWVKVKSPLAVPIA